MKLIREHINEKFEEDSDSISDMGIGVIHEIKQRSWNISTNDITKILKGKHEILIYRNTCVLIYYSRKTKRWRAVTDIYPKDSKSYLSSYEDTKEAVIKRIKLGIGKKLNKLQVNEKFEEDSDPIHDMNIGPQDKVYKCISCGNLIDENGDFLEGEDLQYAKSILNIFKDRIIPTQCISCYQEEQDNQEQENYAREQERKWQRQQEEEERWQQDRFHEDDYERR
jgi:hypothetical protein